MILAAAGAIVGGGVVKKCDGCRKRKGVLVTFARADSKNCDACLAEKRGRAGVVGASYDIDQPRAGAKKKKKNRKMRVQRPVHSAWTRLTGAMQVGVGWVAGWVPSPCN